MPPPQDEALDALRFALTSGPGRLARWNHALTALARAPGAGLAVLRARLSGKRLRARQSLAALVGIDHRLTIPTSRAPRPEPEAALARHDIVFARPDDPDALLDPGGSIVLLAAPGHTLVEGAADAIAEAFAEDSGLQALYGDALFRCGRGRLLPVLRPAFDPDHLRALDCVGPLVAVHRMALSAAGSDLAPGAEALDLILRIDARYGAGAVRHLPRVLSCWRPGPPSGPNRAARLAAIRADLARRGIAAELSQDGHGVIDVARPLPEPAPLVSLIVPTRDRLDLLRPCIESLLHATDWPAREILICDNDSHEPETLAYFRALTEQGRARVVPCPGPFDFAAMNNTAAGAARGRLLAFVNNDVEAFRPDWLARMVREALRPEIGAVGAKLLDAEGRIQHGGVVLGAGGLVGHGHRFFPGDAPGYLGALKATHRVAAVTAACLVVEASKFAAVGGFDAARFSVDFNDVDLCLRLNAAGFATLLVPGAVLHHREAASRRWSEAARERHLAEVERFRARWSEALAGDRHYHPGFDPHLSTHARLRGGWTGREPARPR